MTDRLNQKLGGIHLSDIEKNGSYIDIPDTSKSIFVDIKNLNENVPSTVDLTPVTSNTIINETVQKTEGGIFQTITNEAKAVLEGLGKFVGDIHIKSPSTDVLLIGSMLGLTTLGGLTALIATKATENDNKKESKFVDGGNVYV